MSDKPKSLLCELLAIVVRIFDKDKPVTDQLVTLADELVNVIEATKTLYPIQLLEDVNATAIPESAPLFKTFKLWLLCTGGLLAGTDTDLNKTDQKKLQDLLAYVNVFEIAEPVLYARVLNTLNAVIHQFFSSHQEACLSMPQSLSIAQVVHESTLGSSLI